VQAFRLRSSRCPRRFGWRRRRLYEQPRSRLVRGHSGVNPDRRGRQACGRVLSPDACHARSTRRRTRPLARTAGAARRLLEERLGHVLDAPSVSLVCIRIAAEIGHGTTDRRTKDGPRTGDGLSTKSQAPRTTPTGPRFTAAGRTPAPSCSVPCRSTPPGSSAGRDC
jgi:hypothetical protein